MIAINEALSAHEAFRRLGYPAGDIYVAMYDRPFVELRSALLREPVLISCSKRPFTQAERDQFLARWPGAVANWNSGSKMTDEERWVIWSGGYIANHTVEFATMMVSKGHTAPIDAAVLA